jgi:hypothetical protein
MNERVEVTASAELREIVLDVKAADLHYHGKVGGPHGTVDHAE